MTKFAFELLSLLMVAGITSCRRDDADEPPPPAANEEEVITTVKLHFHSLGGSEHKHFVFSDLDGDGGNAPVIDTDTLSSDTTYLAEIELLNQSVSPEDDITAEVEAEGTDHQFFFQVSGANVSVSYADSDINGYPIGLETSWTIGGASAGSVIVTLRHLPEKAAAGVSTGDITNAGGETDAEVAFPLVID